MKTERREKMHRFLKERLEKAAIRRGVSAPFDESTNVIAAGMIDSMGYLELVTAFEEAFDLRLDFSALDPETFTTIRGILKLAAEAEATK